LSTELISVVVSDPRRGNSSCRLQVLNHEVGGRTKVGHPAARTCQTAALLQGGKVWEQVGISAIEADLTVVESRHFRLLPIVEVTRAYMQQHRWRDRVIEVYAVCIRSDVTPHRNGNRVGQAGVVR